MKKSDATGLLLVVAILGVPAFVYFREPPKNVVGASTQPTTADAKKQLWTCGMHPQVIQDHLGSCPICHMKLTPMKAAGDGMAGNEKKVAYWWDPMLGPSSIADHPGKSAMGMDLVPVYEQQVQAGPGVQIDPTVVQNMGLRTALVTRGPITKSVRTVGVLEAPETGLYDISPKVGGWIKKLYANQDGMHVHKGDPLFDLYSPDLVVAEEELIGAVKSLPAIGATSDDSLKKSSEALVESAKRKLRLLDVDDEEINAIAEKLVASRTITFRSPASGAVIDKAVVEGSSTQPGQKLMRIEDHSTLWLQLQLYEDQMASVAVGDEVQATVDAFPGKTFAGQITFVHPHVDHMSRTAMARTVLENSELSLRPGMYASAAIVTKPVADAIQVPREAVIDTGTRQIAFVADAEGHFQPRVVHMGVVSDDGRVQILDGLSPGEAVVTSGQFLLDVESRTTEAVEKLRSSSAPDTIAPTNDGMAR